MKSMKAQLRDAVLRAQVLGSALWCVYNFPQECTWGDKKPVNGERVAKLIEKHYPSMWPEGGLHLMNRRYLKDEVNKWLRPGRIDGKPEAPQS